MKIAFNIKPLKSAHKERGIGYYTRNLLEGLKKEADLEIVEFEDLSQVRNADVVHFSWFDLFFHTMPLSSPLPTVVTVHDVIPLIFKDHYPVGLRGKINFFLQKLALKRCKRIITDSYVSKVDIVKYLKIDESKIAVVPLASDQKFKVLNESKLLFIKRKYNLPDRFLLYVGDANFVKNLPFLIECFNELIAESQFADLKLILVGEVFLKNVESIDHPELESLKKVLRMIKDLGLADKVLRPGRLEVEDLVAFYNLATVYVQPSLYEGFGLPVLEALSCGTPAVISQNGALKEVGGDAPLYFNPENKRQFKTLVAEVLQSKSLQQKLSKLALTQAAKFSWERVAAQTKSVYLEIKK